MTAMRIAWLVAGVLAVVGCGGRDATPRSEAASVPRAVEAPPAVADTLQGDSVMARDTARVPE